MLVPYLFPHLEGRHAGARRRGVAKLWRMEEGLQRFRRARPAAARLPLPPHRRPQPGASRGRALGRHEDHRAKTESVYRRYAIVRDADLQEAARKLAGTFPGTSSTASLDSPSATAQNP